MGWRRDRMSNLCACSSGVSSNSNTARSGLNANDGGLAIGDPCQPGDGWQPPDPGIGASGDGSTPVAESPSELADAAWLDFPELPPGIGYCLTPGGVYPRGYFTMNCSVDSDCRGVAFCEGASSTTIGQCRRECFGDADCGSGRSCSGVPKAFCQGLAPTLGAN
jgi:hypothetical protein